MTVLDEIKRIREAEGDSLNYSIQVAMDYWKRIPGIVMASGEKGRRYVHLRKMAKNQKKEYYNEAKRVVVKCATVVRPLLDGTREETVFHEHTILVKKLSKKNYGKIYGLEIEFRKFKEGVKKNDY